MQFIDINRVERTISTRVWSVAEFCKRYRLDKEEQTRLQKLLGDFASQHELLMNARRPPVYR